MRAWEVPAPAAHPAHHRDIKVRLLRRDEPKNDYRVSLSRAKKAAAFFRISRSCSRTRTRRRSCVSSSLSSLLRRPSRRPASTSIRFDQFLSVCAETPSALATSAIDRPARTSSTASRRKSSGYGGRVLGTHTTSFPPGRTDPSDQVSTTPGHSRASNKGPPFCPGLWPLASPLPPTGATWRWLAATVSYGCAIGRLRAPRNRSSGATRMRSSIRYPCASQLPANGAASQRRRLSDPWHSY